MHTMPSMQKKKKKKRGSRGHVTNIAVVFSSPFPPIHQMNVKDNLAIICTPSSLF